MSEFNQHGIKIDRLQFLIHFWRRIIVPESGADTFYSLSRGLYLPDVPLHRTRLSHPDEHFHPRICLRGRQDSEVQLQWHKTVQHSTAGLSLPSPCVGGLCARDQNRRELFPQRVHTGICHHQAQSLDWRQRWTCHTRPSFRPLQGAHDDDIFPNDDTAEVLVVEADHGGTALIFVNVYIPPASSRPRNFTPDYDALLEDRRDQMVLGDFNAHNLS